jgi:hypothetical protein
MCSHATASGFFFPVRQDETSVGIESDRNRVVIKPQQTFIRVCALQEETQKKRLRLIQAVHEQQKLSWHKPPKVIDFSTCVSKSNLLCGI